MITSIDRRTCRLLMQECAEALTVVAARHGLNLTRRPGRFTNAMMTFKCEFTVQNEEGTPADFVAHARRYGLRASDHGREFKMMDGSSAILVGINPRARKYPMVGERRSDGQRFKFSASFVRGQFTSPE